MSRTARFLRALVVVATMIPLVRAAAQRDDEEWLRDCRDQRNNGGWNRSRETHCEVRESRMRAPGGTVRMEGLRNGGVSVTGWDRDSIVVKTRIRAQSTSMAGARAIAGQVRTVFNGATITGYVPIFLPSCQ